MKMSLEKSGEKKLRNKNLTVPNAMSVFRILVIPFFAYFFLTDHLAAAVVALLLSGLSDALDGLVARRFNQITELGKMLDPLADKLTQGAVAVCIAIRYPSICPLLFLLVTKELVMLCGACFLLHRPDDEGAPRFSVCPFAAPRSCIVPSPSAFMPNWPSSSEGNGTAPPGSKPPSSGFIRLDMLSVIASSCSSVMPIFSMISLTGLIPSSFAQTRQ